MSNSNCSNETDFTYDIHGNLKSNLAIAGTFNYGEVVGGNTVRPHAITSISNGGSTTASFNYNDKGEMISGNGRTVTYTSYGKPTQITDSGSTVEFIYDSNKSRIQKEEGTEVTTYFENMERVEDGTDIEIRHYLGDFAILTQQEEVVSSRFLTYLHRDHIGSIVTQSGEIADQNDVLYLGLGPWGQRQDWEENPIDVVVATLVTDRGFTDHEHVDSVGLIHMNGRVYDPELGRFLSPDPNVGDSRNTQAYNRYSYVWNNPLRYIDPTGEDVADPAFPDVPEDIPEVPVRGRDLSCQADPGCIRMNENLTEFVNRIVQHGQDLAFDSESATLYVAIAVLNEVVVQDIVGAVQSTTSGDAKGAIKRIVLVVAKPVKLVQQTAKAAQQHGSALSARIRALTGGEVNGSAGSIRNVNPTKGKENCVNCSIATDARLAGRPASALPGGITSISKLEKHFGGKFGPPVTRKQIESSFLVAGSGSRGIVFGSRGNQPGHVFNVVNQGGNVRFLDGQTGKVADFEDFKTLQLLRTD